MRARRFAVGAGFFRVAAVFGRAALAFAVGRLAFTAGASGVASGALPALRRAARSMIVASIAPASPPLAGRLDFQTSG